MRAPPFGAADAIDQSLPCRPLPENMLRDLYIGKPARWVVLSVGHAVIISERGTKEKAAGDAEATGTLGTIQARLKPA